MKPYTPERVTGEQQNNRLKYLIIHSIESFLTKDTTAVWYIQVPRCFFISAFLSWLFCHYTCSHSRSAKFCANELSENKHECNCGIYVTHDLQNVLSFLHSVSLCSPDYPGILYVEKLTKPTCFSKCQNIYCVPPHLEGIIISVYLQDTGIQGL